MKLTTNYGFKKPEGSDVVNIEDFNYNSDIIDTNLSNLTNKVNSGQNHKLTHDGGLSITICDKDLNEIELCGIYNGDNLTNAPNVAGGSGWWFIENKTHCNAPTHIVQYATSMNFFDENGEVYKYYRVKNSSWGAWKKVEGNVRELINTNKTNISNLISKTDTNKTNISNLISKTDTTNTNLSNLTTKVNNGQTYRLTNASGDYQEYSGSINSLTSGGFYTSSSTSGAPSSESSWWYYEVIVHPHKGNVLQKAMNIDGTISYYRWGNANGSWNAWRNEKSADANSVTLYNGWVPDVMHPTVYKYGNIVHLSLSIKNGSTAVNTKIGSVPNGYKPRSHTIVHGMVCDAKYNAYNGSIVIGTDGTIAINDFRGYNTRNIFNAFWEV